MYVTQQLFQFQFFQVYFNLNLVLKTINFDF